MKKIIVALITLLLPLIILVSCGDAKKEGDRAMKKAREKKENEVTEYVDKAVGYIDQSKDMNKQFEQRNKKMEEELLKDQ